MDNIANKLPIPLGDKMITAAENHALESVNVNIKVISTFKPLFDIAENRIELSPDEQSVRESMTIHLTDLEVDSRRSKIPVTFPVELPLVGGGKISFGIDSRGKNSNTGMLYENLVIGLETHDTRGQLKNFGYKKFDGYYYSRTPEEKELVQALARLDLAKDVDPSIISQASPAQKFVLEKLNFHSPLKQAEIKVSSTQSQTSEMQLGPVFEEGGFFEKNATITTEQARALNKQIFDAVAEVVKKTGIDLMKYGDQRVVLKNDKGYAVVELGNAAIVGERQKLVWPVEFHIATLDGHTYSIDAQVGVDCGAQEGTIVSGNASIIDAYTDDLHLFLLGNDQNARIWGKDKQQVEQAEFANILNTVLGMVQGEQVEPFQEIYGHLSEEDLLRTGYPDAVIDPKAKAFLRRKGQTEEYENVNWQQAVSSAAKRLQGRTWAYPRSVAEDLVRYRIGQGLM